MSRIVERAIRRAGITATSEPMDLFAADLLALGALADRLRRARHGDRTRIGAGEADAVDVVVRSGGLPELASLRGRPVGTVVVRPDREAPATGEEILRTAAVCRVALDVVHVAVAWEDIGIELAQVALSFGVDELRGPVGDGALRRGIPRAELEDLIRKAGREAA